MSQKIAEFKSPSAKAESSGNKSGAEPIGSEPQRELKLRHQKFIEYYLANGGNATQAARDAGYSPNPGSLRTLGCWLLKKPEIQQRIRTRILEGARVQTDEVLGVLVHRMRSNLMDVIDDNGQVDLQAVRELDLGHLVKKVTILKPHPRGGADPSDVQPERRAQTVKLELQSPSDGVNQLARMLRRDSAAARQGEHDRLVKNIRDAFDQSRRDAQQSDPGLSIEELFERFAEAESPNYGRNIRLYKQQILQRFDTDAKKKQALSRSA